MAPILVKHLRRPEEDYRVGQGVSILGEKVDWDTPRKVKDTGQSWIQENHWSKNVLDIVGLEVGYNSSDGRSGHNLLECIEYPQHPLSSSTALTKFLVSTFKATLNRFLGWVKYPETRQKSHAWVKPENAYLFAYCTQRYGGKWWSCPECAVFIDGGFWGGRRVISSGSRMGDSAWIRFGEGEMVC